MRRMAAWATTLFLMLLLTLAPAMPAGAKSSPPGATAAQPAAADQSNPVEDAAEWLVETISGSAVQPAAVPANPTSDDDSGGHETANPQEPSHASGSIAETQLLDNELVTLGESRTEVRDDDSTSGDATVLAIGGSEIVGAHSNSGGPTSDSQDPFAALCDGSAGAICVGLLFAETQSTESTTQSNATADQELAGACVGGAAPNAFLCGTAPIQLGVSRSSSSTSRDKTTGATHTHHETAVATTALGPLAISALGSESDSRAPTENGNGQTSRSSYLLAINGPQITDPVAIELPPGCAPVAITCIYFNQGESFVYAGGGASRQEALHLQVLAFSLDTFAFENLLFAHVSTSETLAENQGPSVKECPDGSFVPIDADCPGGGGGGGDELAFGGSDALRPFALALILTVGGALALAWDRRRMPAFA